MIKAKRESDDNQDVLFVIELESGRETIFHRSHIRHNVTTFTPVTETKMRFSIPGENEDSTDRDGNVTNDDSAKKKKGRPKKGSEMKKPTDDATSSGIAWRTCNRQRSSLPDTTAQPKKNCLKKREPHF